MVFDTVRLERQQLYDMVWEKPMTTLSKEFGISDVGLRKICKRMNIPLPPQGYHLKSKKGKKAPLPAATKGEEVYEARVLRQNAVSEDESAGQVIPEIEFEKRPENRIMVLDRLSSSPHQLVELTKAKVDGKHVDEMGRIFGESGGGVAVRIYPESARRVLRILDALLKALEARGYELVTDKKMNLGGVKVLGHHISISCWGRAKRILRPLTPEEQKKARQDPSWEPYPKYVFQETDDLFIKLSAGCGCESTISDSPRRRMEASLNDLIVRMIKLSLRAQAEEEERNRWHREYEERRQRHQELVERHRAEQAKIEKLHEDAKEWVKSQQLRAYIEAVRESALKRHGAIDAGSELEEWLKWAHQQADRLDPLAESPASILDEKIPSFW